MSQLPLLLLGLIVLGERLEALHLTYLTGNQFLTKIKEKSLDPSVVFKYIDKVRQKEELAIGSTNLQRLHSIHKIESGNCLDESYKERMQICSAAKEAKLENINRYCQSMVDQLAQHCSDIVDYLITESLMSADPDTLDYFRSLVKNHYTELSPNEYKSIIDEHVGENWDDERGSLMDKSCTKLLENFSAIGAEIDHGIKVQAGLSAKLSHKAAGWTNAYKLCQHFQDKRGRARF